MKLYRLKQFLGMLEHHELVDLKQQIEKGSLDLSKEIRAKIKDYQKKHEKYCGTCSNDIDPYNTNSYTLLFGPEDFKKKASFCGLDCLEYFLISLKELKKGGKSAEKIE